MNSRQTNKLRPGIKGDQHGRVNCQTVYFSYYQDVIERLPVPDRWHIIEFAVIHTCQKDDRDERVNRQG